MNTKITYCPFYADCIFNIKCAYVLPEKYRDNIKTACNKLNIYAMKPLCHSDYIK